MIVCEIPGVVFINQAFKKSEKIMLVSYQAEKIQYLTVSGLMDIFLERSDHRRPLIRRTHHPAGRIERIFVFTNFDRKQSNKIFLQVLNIQDIRSQTMHIFDFLILANFQNFLLNCNHSAIKSSILNVNMTDES